MFRKSLGILFFTVGLALVLGAFSGVSTPQSAQAQGVPQPTPRPPLPPGEDKKTSIDTGSGMGHIAGTVIDLTTGAPAPNMTVMVGDYQITTDVNGNYDRWLPSGSYTLILVVSKDKGEAAQGPMSVALPEAERVIQHLSFYGVVAPAAPAAPAAAVAPTAIPVQSKARPVEKTTKPAAPTRLPRTGDDSQNFLFLVSIGIALMAAGVFIGMQGNRLPNLRPVLAHATPRLSSRSVSAPADMALLASLLTTKPVAPKQNDAELLEALLGRKA